MRIAHITDLHIGFHHQDRLQIFAESLTNCDLIMVSGDITHRAKKKQFLSAYNFLQSLNIKVICVPGNHDIPLRDPIRRLFFPFLNYNKIMDFPSYYENDEIAVLGVNSVNPRRIKRASFMRIIIICWMIFSKIN